MEAIIPPWVRPESPETLRIIDDATTALQPAFGRGMTQRGIWADPRWGLRRRYRGLRFDEQASILTALNETRGQTNILRVTPHKPIRGGFVTSELLPYGMFPSSTTGWSTAADFTLSVSDRVGRMTRLTAATGQETALYSSSSITTVANAPYAMRYMLMPGRGTFASGHSPTLNGVASFGAINSGFGLFTGAIVVSNTSVAPGIAIYDSAAGTMGEYFSVPYVSYARCALVDNGVNIFERSDAIDDAVWTKNQSTVVANAITAPDGTATGDQLYENAVNTGHNIQRSLTVSSSPTDIFFGAAVRQGTNRNFAELLLIEATSSTVARVYFNMLTGVVGTTATGANWSNLRSVIYTLGNGWYYVGIVAKKTNVATTVNAFLAIASADGTDSYAGNVLNYIGVWRVTIGFSSVFSRLAQTAASPLTTGTAQPGGGLYTKGWPASTSNLLLAGDWIEVNGELKQLTASVNSDAAGLAYIQFRPGLAGTPADNDAVVVFEPFGRFLYSGTREIENMFGIYGDCEMNLEETYS